ncbi:hypothetical protein, partial [Nocardioides sp.]|uniref:hypothetical protein n=1 Tax=Nocardioides sp. TaxID=35761 RepID=UPI002638222E
MSAWLAALLAAMALAVWVPAAPAPHRPRRSGREWPTALPGLGRRRETAADRAAVLEVCDLVAA